jgi:WD40 repeat protein
MGGCASADSSRASAYAMQQPTESPQKPKAQHAVQAYPQWHQGSVLDVCAAGDPYHAITCGEDQSAHLVDLARGAVVHRWAGHEGPVQRVSYCSSAQLAATASRDLTIRLWKPSSSECAGVLRGHDLSVNAVALSGFGRRCVSGGRDTTVRLWDVETQKQLVRTNKPQNVVTCIKWYPGDDGAIAVQGSEDLRVRLWDTRSAPLRECVALEGYVYFPLACDVSPDGRYILTSSKGFNGVGCEARLWDLRRGGGNGSSGSGSGSGGASSAGPWGADSFVRNEVSPAQVGVFQGHTQDTTACAFLHEPLHGSDVHAFVTASKDGSLRLWNRDGLRDSGRDSGRDGAKDSLCLSEHFEPSAGAWMSLAVLRHSSSGDPPNASGSTDAEADAGADAVAEAGAEAQKPAWASKGPLVAATSSNGGVYVFAIQRDYSFVCKARTK